MTTTTKTTKTFDFSTIKALNKNFSAAREAFGWPEPHDGESLSNYAYRLTLDDPHPEFLDAWVRDGVTVSLDEIGCTADREIEDTMSYVILDIVGEEWSSAAGELSKLDGWMPDKEEFMRDHDDFRDKCQEAIGMLPHELRLDPEWYPTEVQGGWLDHNVVLDRAIRRAVSYHGIDEFLRKAVREAIEEAMDKARAAMEEALAKMYKEMVKEVETIFLIPTFVDGRIRTTTIRTTTAQWK